MAIRTVLKASFTLLSSCYIQASPLHPKITYIEMKSFLNDSTVGVQELRRKKCSGGEMKSSSHAYSLKH